MQEQKGFQQVVPHLIVLAVFLLISCIFCYPAFQGNIINQHDTFTWLYGSKESRDFYEATGKNAFWANNMFSGMPQVLVDFYPKTNWYHKLNQMVQLYTHGEVSNPATYFFIAMVSFYILLSVLRVNKWLSMIGAIAFAFSSYNPIIISAGHTTKMLDIAFLPAIVGGVLWAYRGRVWVGAALAGIFLAFFFDSGHYQIIYYGAILIAVIAMAQLFFAFRNGRIKTWLFASGALLLAATFAFATSAARIIMTQEYNPYTIRGGVSELDKDTANQSTGLDREYAFAWSNGIGETFCILVPNLYGGSPAEDIGTDSHFGTKLAALNVPPQYVAQMTANAPTYWGPQSFTQPVYFGAIICLLTVLSLLVIRSRFKWWLAGTALFFIFLSLGKHFATLNYFLFDHLPIYNKFRTPSMALVIPSLLFPLLGIWALRDLFTGRVANETLVKNIKLSVYITGGLCIVIILATYFFLDFTGLRDAEIANQYGQMFQNQQIGAQLLSALRLDRAEMARSDAFRSLFLIIVAGAVLWSFAKDKINKNLAIAGIGLLVGVDEIPIAHRYLNEGNFLDEQQYAQQFQPTAADLQIMKDPDLYYRVYDLSNQQSGPFNDPRPSYFHKSVGGYHGAKLSIYQDLIEHQLGKLNSAVINMLNTKYLILPGQNGQPVVQQNPDALGNAWFVSEINWAANAAEAMEALNAPSLQNPADTSMGVFRPQHTVILRDSLQPHFKDYSFGKDSSATIRLVHYAPNSLRFESHNAYEGLAVFSDIYYPKGWTATIDGKEVPIYRADYVLRALKIPAGTHQIEFHFYPTSFDMGKTISLVGSILLTLLIVGGVFVWYKKGRIPPSPGSDISMASENEDKTK